MIKEDRIDNGTLRGSRSISQVNNKGYSDGDTRIRMLAKRARH